MDFIKKIELNVEKEDKFDCQPLLDGDVAYTFADALTLQNATGYTLGICGKEGVARVVEWYQTSHTKKQNEKYLCSYHRPPFL